MNPSPSMIQRPRVPWRELVLYFLGTRLLIALVALGSGQVLRQGDFAGGASSLLERLSRWDAGWYLSIVRAGYAYNPGAESSVAFFPLYPMLVRVVSWLVRDEQIAGFVVSNLALFGAVVLLWMLIEPGPQEDAGPLRPGDGLRTIRWLLVGPVSFFFSTIYSESLFLFFVAGCLCAARRRAWLWAGLAGVGAALTRNAGVLLVAPLLLEALDVRWCSLKPQLPSRWYSTVGFCLLPFLGLLIWMSYLGFTFGEPLAFMKTQAAWNRRLSWPWEPFQPGHLAGFPVFYRYWFVAAATTGIAGLLWCVIARIRLSWVLFAGLLLLLGLSGRHLEGIPRYLSCIFPLYLAAVHATRKHPNLEWLAYGLSVAALTVFTILFANGYWCT